MSTIRVPERTTTEDTADRADNFRLAILLAKESGVEHDAGDLRYLAMYLTDTED